MEWKQKTVSIKSVADRMTGAFGLVLILLVFDVLPCLFHTTLTKKLIIGAIVQVQKHIQLM